MSTDEASWQYLMWVYHDRYVATKSYFDRLDSADVTQLVELSDQNWICFIEQLIATHLGLA